MAITRWRPSRDIMNMRDEVDRLFNEFFGGYPERSVSGETAWTPLTDVSESDNDIIVTMELPGVEKKDVNISVQNNTLNIRGEKRQEEEKKEENYHRMECCYGSFQRSFTLPTAVDANKIKATFKDGVLQVKFPKVEEAKKKEIPISVE